MEQSITIVKNEMKDIYCEIDRMTDFDFGGREITLIHSLGHTKGYIVLLDRKTK